MAVNWDDFWGRAAPGMFDLGVGLYGTSAGSKEASNRLRTAQGPLYDAQMGAAQTALAQAGNMDPQAFAQQRFNQNTALLAGKDAADEQDLLRYLRARGRLGAASFNPGVEGITPNGTPMNPQLAAFYAARNARDAKLAVDSYDQGQAQIDNYLKRSGMLGQGAAATQASGMAARGQLPSRSKANVALLKGAGSILKDTGMLKSAGDWLKGAAGGLGDFFSGGPDPYAAFSGGQGLEDVLSGFSDSNDWWSSVF